MSRLGALNPNWKGGSWINSKGYVMVLVGKGHPMANCRQYAPRGRVVCYETHGLPQPGQHVHHKDRDKQNDTPDNVEWRWPSDHGRHHLTPERARTLGRMGGKKAARNRRRERRRLEQFTRKKNARVPRRLGTPNRAGSPRRFPRTSLNPSI